MGFSIHYEATESLDLCGLNQESNFTNFLISAIFGALQRATTWHGARVFIITREQETNLPDWLSVATLRVEIMPQSYLCDCHHIQVLIYKLS